MAKKAPAKKETAKKTTAKPAAEKKAAKPKKEAAPKAKKVVAEEPAEEIEAAPVKAKKEKAPKEPKVPRVTKAQAAADKASSDATQKWLDLKEKYGDEKAATYSMSSVYEANKPLQHKVLGWGFIQSVQNDRLEVLFESGPKMLISNYKTK